MSDGSPPDRPAGSPGAFHTRPLDREECLALLRRQQVGRLAFSFRDRVDIRPLGYAFRDGWIFGRTEAGGGKLETLGHHRWVAFQVDEIHDLWNWSSVVVHGAFHLLDEDAGGEQARIREVGLAALSQVFPHLYTDRDPGRPRSLLFAVDLQEVAGVMGSLQGGEASRE